MELGEVEAEFTVGAPNDRVAARPRRYDHLNLRIGFGKVRQVVLEEGLHAARRAAAVAVVEVQPFALEDESTHPILRPGDGFKRSEGHFDLNSP